MYITDLTVPANNAVVVEGGGRLYESGGVGENYQKGTTSLVFWEAGTFTLATSVFAGAGAILVCCCRGRFCGVQFA